MNEMAGIRQKLEKGVGQRVPDWIWNHERVQKAANDYLEASGDAEREEEWSILEEEAGERLDAWNEGAKENLRGLQSRAVGGSQAMREAEQRDAGETSQRSLDARKLVSDRTKAMTEAMSAWSALIGDQFPEVKDFREQVLPGRWLTANEAHALISSAAARTMNRSQFQEWQIPFIGHHAEILTTGPRGPEFNAIDDSITVQVSPPGVTKTVRYALPEEEDQNTRCMVQSNAVIPIHTGLPIEPHGDHVYGSWLWPGSVVDELYELSVELAGAFDWPMAAWGNLSGTRPRSESGAWFVLTGEVPQVRPINAKWETKRGSTNLGPQWRIQLTIPPWLPEEEVLQAFRALRRQRPKGRQMPKTAKPLEVARFVYERDRVDYHEPPPWTAWLKLWNEKHPGHRINSASNFRTLFHRGNDAVTHLNFDWPKSRHPRRSSDTN